MPFELAVPPARRTGQNRFLVTSKRSGQCLEFVFSKSDEPLSRPLLHYGVWDNFSPQKTILRKTQINP
jgi:hypothetical protein